MSYSRQYGFPKHSDCANFRNGSCALNGVAVNPDGAACPNFTPKSIMPTSQAARSHLRAEQSSQLYPPRIRQSLPPYVPNSLPPPQTMYGYRISYGSNCIPSSLTTPGQRGVGFFSISSRRRSRGRRRRGLRGG